VLVDHDQCPSFSTKRTTSRHIGLGFLVLAIVEFVLGETYNDRQIMMLIAVSLWAVRLAGYLLYRILKIGRDARFDNMRDSVVKFGVFWLLQFVTVWINFLPQTLLFSNPKTYPLG
jgi:steroid 5-alpha reductase family enzyme